MTKMIGYTLIFGKPLLFYLGIITLISFLLTALVAVLNHRGNHAIPFKFHPKLAYLSILLALIHGTLSILAYL